MHLASEHLGWLYTILGNVYFNALNPLSEKIMRIHACTAGVPLSHFGVPKLRGFEYGEESTYEFQETSKHSSCQTNLNHNLLYDMYLHLSVPEA